MRIIGLLTLLCILVLTGCSGKDKLTVDKTPPLPAVMIPHSGDAGDHPIGNVLPDDENNGIDAVPDGNWIRISWQHLLDSDLDYLKIYRYDDITAYPELIDSIAANQEFYVDSRNQLSTNVRYSYFIESIDNAGNSTRSDTVSYKLLSKQIQDSPAAEMTLTNQNLGFSWQKSGFVSIFRILLFDQNHNYVWHRDINVAAEGDFYNVTLPVTIATDPLYIGQPMYWRVDAFDWDSELEMFIGSESSERVVYFAGE